MTITHPGCYTISAADYHADSCPTPSLSASVAKVLIASSPRHAAWVHPRLNPAYVPEERHQFDLGRAAHAYLLEGETAFVIVDAPDWRTKAAQEVRDAARAAGKTPLLAAHWATVQAMVQAAREQLVDHEAPIPFTAGMPEQTLVWREGSIWCRARLDWLSDDRRTIDDYKTTSASAHPDAWGRTMFWTGHDIQAAFYARGVRAVFGLDATFRFIPQEIDPPYALSVVGLSPDARILAEKKVQYAIDAWQRALETGLWIGYPARTCYVDLPGWHEAQWLERETREEATA